MTKKSTAIAAMLALTLVASTPALAQLVTTDCSDLYPGTLPMDCAVDENGLIVLPDGTKAPYTITGNPVRVQDDDRFPDPELYGNSAGFVQYDNS